MKAAISTLALSLALCSATWAAGPSRNPTTNPDAVPHQIDRSAMKVQIQGWTPDLRYPIYPIEVRTGSSGVWYNTSTRAQNYAEFNFPELRCEIGDAPIEVLKDPKYHCADGVCFTRSGGHVIGTDPRVKAKRAKC